MSTDPEWLDTGDNAWQLTAASFVALQSVPGLVLLYAGSSKSKWSINSAFMAFYAFAATLIVWVLYAYKMGFGEQWIPLCGTPGNVLGIGTQLGQSTLPAAGLSQNFPLATMVYFQFVFAAITIIITAGAFLNRMNFYAWMVFVPLWITFAYTIGAFSIWAGGFLFQLGVIDYSGGYVIHISSGVSGFVGSAIIGPRHPVDRAEHKPSNLGFVMLGAGLLWIGWNGFNGGDPYAASPDAGVAVINTNVCTAMSMLTWTALDTIYYKKPAILGSVQGMITGLVAITPAAGVIAGWGAIAMGFLSGSIPWMTMTFSKKLSISQYFDDVLGVTHTHLVAGFVGGFFTGIFATVEGCAAFGLTNPGGAIAGNGRQVWVQIVGALFVIGWDGVWTALILFFIKYVMRIPLRMKDETLLLGDEAVHGEAAYSFDNIPLLHTNGHDHSTAGSIHSPTKSEGHGENGNKAQGSSDVAATSSAV